MDRLDPIFVSKDRWLVLVPADAGDLFISGSGYLCARNPFRHVVFDQCLSEARLPTDVRVCGRATATELAAVGMDSSVSAIVLESGAL